MKLDVRFEVNYSHETKGYYGLVVVNGRERPVKKMQPTDQKDEWHCYWKLRNGYIVDVYFRLDEDDCGYLENEMVQVFKKNKDGVSTLVYSLER